MSPPAHAAELLDPPPAAPVARPTAGLPEAVRRAIEAAPMGPPDTEEEARSVAAARAADVWLDHKAFSEIVKECRRT